MRQGFTGLRHLCTRCHRPPSQARQAPQHTLGRLHTCTHASHVQAQQARAQRSRNRNVPAKEARRLHPDWACVTSTPAGICKPSVSGHTATHAAIGLQRSPSRTMATPTSDAGASSSGASGRWLLSASWEEGEALGRDGSDLAAVRHDRMSLLCFVSGLDAPTVYRTP